MIGGLSIMRNPKPINPLRAHVEQKVQQATRQVAGGSAWGGGETSLYQTTQLEEKFENIFATDPATWDKALRTMADILERCYKAGEKELSAAIESVVRLSENLEDNKVPAEFVNMAFFQYARLLSSDKSAQLTQYTAIKYPLKVRYAAATAAAEYSKYFIDSHFNPQLNTNPPGRLELNLEQRKQVTQVLNEAYVAFDKDSAMYEVQVQVWRFRIARLWQDSQFAFTLGTMTGQANLAAGSASAVFLLRDPRVLLALGTTYSAYVSTKYALGWIYEAYNLKNLEDSASALTYSVEKEIEVEFNEDSIMRAVAVEWDAQAYSKIGAEVSSTNGALPPNCGEQNNSSESDWEGPGSNPWYKNRFPGGVGGNSMMRKVDQLRKVLRGNGFDVTKSSSLRTFIVEGRKARQRGLLDRESQMTLRELEQINKKIVNRSFINTARPGDANSAYTKAIKKSNGEWQPSVEIGISSKKTGIETMNDVLAPNIVQQIKQAVCRGLDISQLMINLGNNKRARFRFGESERNSSKPHFHYEDDRENYQCNRSVFFEGTAEDFLNGLKASCGM